MTSVPDKMLQDPTDLFAKNYNRSSFMFAHGLAGNPVFELPSLVALSRRLPSSPDFVYWSNGPVRIDDRWEAGSRAAQSLQETLENIRDNNSLVIMKHVEEDPVFAPILKPLLAQVIELAGADMREDVIVGEVLILVSSPKRLTAYHIDAEVNYLIQLTGDKIAHVFPPNDPEIVTDVELEQFHAGDFNSAAYRPASQDRATTYDLRAGYGIHIPTHAPHWVQNGDGISVALSVNYELRSVARQAKLLGINRWLRRRGLAPRRPGISVMGDQIKLSLAQAASVAKRLVRARPPAWQDFITQ